MAYKVIKWLIIPIFAILLMSHNASAIDFTYDLNNYELVRSFPSGVNYCNIDGGFNIDQGRAAYCSFLVQGTTTIKSITFKPNFDIKKGDLLEYYILLFINTPNAYSPTLNNIGIGSNFSTLNFELVMDDNLYNEFQSQGGYINWSPNNDLNPGNYIQIRKNFYIYKVSQIALRDLTAPDIGLDISSSSSGIFQFDANALGVSVYARIRNLNVYRFSPSDEDAAAKKELESTENIENQDTSDTPGGDNESATNLIGNISGIFNQINSIPASSNCNISANFGNLDLGNLNLCTGKEKMPFIVNFGATVFQLVFVVSTGLILIRQVLGLYDWSRK